MSKRILIFCLIAIVSMGCSNKETYLSEFDGFVSEVEENYKSYSQEKWVEVNDDYDLYNTERYEKYKDKFTEEDQKAIGRYKYRYFKIIIASEIEGIKTNTQNAMKQLEGFIEAMETN